MYLKFSVKLVSLFLIGSVCLLGYVSMSTWASPTPTIGKVAISNQVQIKQGVNVSYYFADDAILDKLEIASTYIKLDNKLKIATATINPINVTIGGRSLNSAHSSWILNSNASTSMTFTLSGLESGRMYRVYIDGMSARLLTASGSGVVSFTYSGPWSEHQFEIVATSIGGSISGLVNLIFIMFGIGVVVGVIVEGTHSLRKKEMLTTEEMTRSLVTMVIYIVIGIASLGVLYSIVA